MQNSDKVQEKKLTPMEIARKQEELFKERLLSEKASFVKTGENKGWLNAAYRCLSYIPPFSLNIGLQVFADLLNKGFTNNSEELTLIELSALCNAVEAVPQHYLGLNTGDYIAFLDQTIGIGKEVNEAVTKLRDACKKEFLPVK